MTTRKAKRKRAPGAGRPPAGERGRKASEYPLVRVTPDALDLAKAAAEARNEPIWKVISEAVRQFARKGG